MTITVKLPDGSTAAFPDGTPQEAMTKAIQAKFPPTGQQATVQRPAAPSLLGSTLATLNHGVTDLPVVGPALQWAGDNLAAQTIGRLAGQDPAAWLAHAQAARSANDAANPIAAVAGGVAGNIAALGAGGGGPVGAEALGLTGKLLPRMVNSGLSTLGLSTADNIARGQPPAQAMQNAIAPSAVAAAVPVVGAGLRRAISPLPIGPQQAAMNQTLQNAGVSLTAGQSSGNDALKYAESQLGGSAAAKFAQNQGEQFTSAALKSAGVQAPAATPAVMDGAFSTLGKKFDTLASTNTLVPDRQLGADLSQAATAYNDVVSPSNRAPIIGKTLNDILDYAQSGQITGPQYADLRSRLNSSARTVAQSDPNLAQALFGIQGALDSGMERSIATNNPAGLGAWKQARSQYANLITIENAVAKAGPQAANGIVTPANLRTAVQSQNKRAYVRGTNGLGTLARAGVSAMTPMPNSGTAARVAAMAIPASLGTAGGLMMQGLPLAAAGTVAGLAAPPLVGRAILSGPGRAYLGNQAASQMPQSLTQALQLVARGGIGASPSLSTLLMQAGAQ